MISLPTLTPFLIFHFGFGAVCLLSAGYWWHRVITGTARITSGLGTTLLLLISALVSFCVAFHPYHQ